MRPLLLLPLLLALAGCETPQTLPAGQVCAHDYDTFVEVTGWLQAHPDGPRCEPRRNLGPQCSYPLRESQAPDSPFVEASILQGVASNQLEERKSGDGLQLFAHDMANVALDTASEPIKVRGRVFPGLRDPSTCRLEVLQIRPGAPTRP